MTDLATTITVLDACARAGVAAILWGDPGIGKSALLQAVAAVRDVPCEVVYGSIREPADIAGLPVLDEGGVRLEPPRWAKALTASGEGLVLFDELSTCAPATQAAMLGVLLDGQVGDVRLPAGVQRVAGANPPEKAADGYDLTPPMANRLLHLDFAPSVDEWLSGMNVGWSAPPPSRAVESDPARAEAVKASVLGFIRSRPDLLHVYPTNAEGTGRAWPSRRTWDLLLRVLTHLRDDDDAARMAATFGLVGDGAGIAYLEWVRAADLPNPADVIADPSIVDWTDRPDRVWAILSAVVGWAASTGTLAAWRDAWGPLLAAATAGAPDVAASAARPLGRIRPAKAQVPAGVRKVFGPVLLDAGMSQDGAA